MKKKKTNEKELREEIAALTKEAEFLHLKVERLIKAREQERDYWRTTVDKLMEINADMVRDFFDDMVDDGVVEPWFDKARRQLGLEGSQEPDDLFLSDEDELGD